MFMSNYLNCIICAGMGEKIGCQRAFFRAAAVVFFHTCLGGKEMSGSLRGPDMW
jgi:hypothetical protein